MDSTTKCTYCGKDFQKTHHNQTLCSDECRYERLLVCNRESGYKTKRRTRPFALPVRNCKHCNKEFLPRTIQNLYCSPDCREVHGEAAKIRRKAYMDCSYGYYGEE